MSAILYAIAAVAGLFVVGVYIWLRRLNESADGVSPSKAKKTGSSSSSSSSSSSRSYGSRPRAPSIRTPHDGFFTDFTEKHLHSNVEKNDALKVTLKGSLHKLKTPFRDGVFKTERNIIGYKATQHGILQLLIPKGAIVVSARHSKKLRTNKVIPIGWFRGHPSTLRSERSRKSDTSIHQNGFSYHLGEMKFEGDINLDTHQECAEGLHFFTNYSDAERWWMRHTGRTPGSRTSGIQGGASHSSSPGSLSSSGTSTTSSRRMTPPPGSPSKRSSRKSSSSGKIKGPYNK